MASIGRSIKSKKKTLEMDDKSTNCIWTDEMCLTEGQKYCVWKEIPEHEVEGHLINFMNLWFTGKCKDDATILSVIRNVLLLTPVGFSTNLLLRDVFYSALETAEIPKATDSEKSVIEEPCVRHLGPKDKAEVLAFHKCLQRYFIQLKIAKRKTLGTKPDSSEYISVSQKLRVVLGFCALLLMRMMIKSEQQFSRYFPSAAMKTFDRLFPTAGLTAPLVAPVPQCIKSISSAFHLAETRHILYLLVFQYLKSNNQRDKLSKSTKQILEEGCLKVMKGNGMGLIKLFQDVQLLYPRIEARELIAMIADHNRDIESEERLVTFFINYVQPSKSQYSWEWARILSPNHFSDMNVRGNTLLCSKLAALLVDKNPGIFEHKYLKDKNPWREFATQWAESNKEKLEQENGD